MFRWTRDAESWGKAITKNNEIFKLQFDLYYAYLLIGLIDGKQRKIDKDAVDVIGNFPEAYKEKSKLIINMLLAVELKARGIDLTSKKHVKALIEKLIEESGNSLRAGGDGGFYACNLYANYGFEIMNENLTKPTGNIRAFMNAYIGLLKNKLGGKNIFSN